MIMHVCLSIHSLSFPFSILILNFMYMFFSQRSSSLFPFLCQLIPRGWSNTPKASRYSPEHKQPSRLKPQEMTSHFSGRRMAVMCTMTATTVELTPAHWWFSMWQRVTEVVTAALWAVRLKRMETCQMKLNLQFVSACLCIGLLQWFRVSPSEPHTRLLCKRGCLTTKKLERYNLPNWSCTCLPVTLCLKHVQVFFFAYDCPCVSKNTLIRLPFNILHPRFYDLVL